MSGDQIFDNIVSIARELLRKQRMQMFTDYMIRINEDYASMTDKDFENFAQLQVLMCKAAEDEDNIRNKNGTQKEE